MKLGAYRWLVPVVAGVALLLAVVAWLRPQTLVREQILLGTFVQIKAYGNESDELEDSVSAAFEEIRRVQNAFSRAGNGELGQLNRSTPGQWVSVSSELFNLLEKSESFSELSNGAFQVTLGKLQDLWGFVEDWDGKGTVPNDDVIRQFLNQESGLRFDVENLRVMRVSESTEVDLGGIAKGYAVDLAIETLKTFSIQAALVNAGGNVRAFGQVPEPILFGTEYRPFQIGVQHPRQVDSSVIGGITINDDQSVATSGDYQRFFTVDDQRYHHVLNPSTGYPSNLLISSTVLAPTALEADALSTVVFVLGAEHGLALVEQLSGVEAVLVLPDGTVLTSSGMDDLVFLEDLFNLR
jgi:thiamine biosynthesis lipoprotein